MSSLKIILKAVALTLFFACFSIGASAQGQSKMSQTKSTAETFSDAQLRQYVSANDKVATMQAEAQEEMSALVKGQENFDAIKFNKYLQAQANPALEVNATPEELALYSELAPKLMQIQQDMQIKVLAALEKEGLDPMKYHSIATAAQKDGKVKTKVDAIMAE